MEIEVHKQNKVFLWMLTRISIIIVFSVFVSF